VRGQLTPRQHLTPGNDPVPIVQEAGWDSGPVWTGAENLAPTGIRSPDRPARRQSLYRDLIVMGENIKVNLKEIERASNIVISLKP